MDPRNSRRPRLVVLVLLQPALLELLTQELAAEPQPEPLQLVLQVPPRMQELQLPRVERPPAPRVLPVPLQARRPRSRPRVVQLQQLRQPRPRRCPTSTS